MRTHATYLTVLLALLCVAPRAEEGGLIGHRMVVNDASNRRGVGGNNPYKRAGEVPIGTLTIPHSHKDAAEPRVLGLRTLEVDTSIDGLTARTTVKHVFQNSTDAMLEGEFTFALPPDSAVDRFAMTIVSESDLMEGSLIDKGNAKQIYSNLVYGIGIDPGVLEWVDGNTFRATIFPIPANGTKTIVVSYVEPLTPKVCPGGKLEISYRYPMIASDDAAGKLAAAQVRLRAQIGAGIQNNAMITSSLQPKMETSKDGDTYLLATFENELKPKDDWTITIRKPLPIGAGSCYLQAHRPDAKAGGVFSITAIPDIDIPPTPEALDVIFLVDTSASQAGAAYGATVKLVEGALAGLSANDRFAIVTFDIQARPMSNGLLAMTAENIEKSLKLLRSVKPMGATDIGSAFTTMAREFARQVRSNAQVVYVGDASPTFGVKDAEQLEAVVTTSLGLLKAEMTAVLSAGNVAEGQNAAAVRKDAMTALAKFSGGPVAEISSNARPFDLGKSLVGSLGVPVLKHAKFSIVSDSKVELVGEQIGGLPLDRSLRIFGQYDKGGEATVKLSGAIQGEPFLREWKVRLPEVETANASVVKLWARTAIGELESKGSAQEASELAKKHSVLSRDTAFLVLESEKMYADYKIARDKKNYTPEELRSRMVAGVRQYESDIGGIPSITDAMVNVRLSGKPALGTSSMAPVSIKNVDIKVALQDVKVCEKQPNTTRPLTNRQIVERRLALSRLIAAERLMPFEPETVFPKQWMTALNTFSSAAAAQTFSPFNDEVIWTTVDAQTINENMTWRTNNAPSAGEDHQDRLMNPVRPSIIKLAPDNQSVAVDSHLLAHQILSWLLLPQSQRIFNGNGASEMMRVIITRKAQVYSFQNVDPAQCAAAFNFLAQLALVEHQSELAEKLADLAIAVMPVSRNGEVARQSLLIKALASQMNGNFDDASKSYQALMQGTKPLVKSGHALTFGAMLTTMAVSGNTTGVVETLEKWSQHEYRSIAVSDRLGEAYLFLHRRDDAIRAFSSVAEFGAVSDVATPDAFLNRRKK